MADFEKLLENIFSKKERVFGVKDLEEFISKINEAKGTKGVPTVSPEEFLKFLPKFELSEKMGQLDNETRMDFSKRVSNLISVGGPKISEKIKYLNKFFAEGPKEDIDISELLQTIVFLKILSNVIYDFSAAGAGFIFEAFMAALLSGEQIVDTQHGSLPIQDIELRGGRGVSLKLLNQTVPVKGSLENLIHYLGRDKANRGIDYYVAVKFADEKLGIYKFTITRDNLFEWIPVEQVIRPPTEPDLEEPESEDGIKEVVDQLIQEAVKEAEVDLSQLISHLITSAPNVIGRPIKEKEYAATNDMDKAKKLEKVYKYAGKLDGLSKDELASMSKKFKTTNRQEISDAATRNAKIFLSDLEREPSDPLSINRIKWTEDRTSPERIGKIARSREARTEQQFDFLDWYNKYMARNPPAESWKTNVLQKIAQAGGAVAGKQFRINQGDIRVIGGNEAYLGHIPLGRHVNTVIDKYSKKLEGDVTSVFKGLAGLTNSINKFYLGGDANSARSGSKQAKGLSDLLAKAKISK